MTSTLRSPSATDWGLALGENLAAQMPDASDQTRGELMRGAHLRTFGRGELLLAQGRIAQLTLLLDGFAAIRRASGEGKHFVVFISSAGEFACASAVTFAECPFDVAALTDGVVATWSGRLARDLAAADPAFCLALLDRSVAIGVGITSRIDMLAFQDVRHRLAQALIDYRDLVFDERRPVIVRSDLPALLGTSREMTSRVLRRFEALGIVRRVGRSGLVLLDERRLRELLTAG
jgi:CRP-like cAMP-binding protein